MSFTLTSFRSYLIQRPKDKSDPDPKFRTVIFHIWPLMFLATLGHTGHTGHTCHTAVQCTGSHDTTYMRCWTHRTLHLPCSCHSIFCQPCCLAVELEDILHQKKNRRQNNIEGNKTSAGEERQLLCPDSEQGRSQSDDLADILLAAFSSIWLPSVVGDQKTIFLVSGMTSLVTKVLLQPLQWLLQPLESNTRSTKGHSFYIVLTRAHHSSVKRE